MVHAAAPCPIETKLRMLDWWGDSIWEYYAATEGGGTVVGPEEWKKFPGTVGRPWTGSEIRILDDDGKDCPTNGTGTVYIKLGAADFEYKGDKKKTEESRREGFFTVGDIGTLNEEGYLFLCDRKSDMIISGGVNIYPAEIENVLVQLPEVMDCAVFGIPDEDFGEAVAAAVQRTSGAALSETDIRSYLKQHMAGYKVPKVIDFHETLPREDTGKIFKRLLRDPYWAAAGRNI